MREFKVFAPAKLNLYLDVLHKRTDGYHDVETLFEKIDLKDEIIVREKKRGIDIKVEPPVCPSGKGNIVYSALKALFKEAGTMLGLEIVIKKNIPVSGGLGGGSSDAASVLRSINEAFNLGVSKERLFSVASEIGKDVPFFLLDVPFAAGKGAGEVIETVDVDYPLSHIVVNPGIAVSTAEMYKRIDRYSRTQKKSGIEEIISALKRKDIITLRKSYYNIFEEVLGDYGGPVAEAKALLSGAGARHGFLSGSGPSVFCIVGERHEAREIFGRIAGRKDMGVYLTTTYKGGIYGDNRGQDISQRRSE